VAKLKTRLPRAEREALSVKRPWPSQRTPGVELPHFRARLDGQLERVLPDENFDQGRGRRHPALAGTLFSQDSRLHEPSRLRQPQLTSAALRGVDGFLCAWSFT
jgi:hypothetical protein